MFYKKWNDIKRKDKEWDFAMPNSLTSKRL